MIINFFDKKLTI